MILGTPHLRIVDDQTDRIGIRTIILAKIWQASSDGLSLAQVLAETPTTPEAPLGTQFVGRQTKQAGGGMLTTWTFDGFEGDPKSVLVKTRGRSMDYGFSPGYAEVPITKHPRIEQLIDDYNGQPLDGEIIWPRKITGEGASAGVGLEGGKAGQQKQSAMYGQNSYITLLGGTYWYRYVALDERSVPETGGRIFSSGGLPGKAPTYANRNWLGMGAEMQRRGPVVEVKETYWLSDDGGWPPPIYRTGSNRSGGNGSASTGTGNQLSIGGLQGGATTTVV